MLQRMTIIGVILCFRKLSQEAKDVVLSQRVQLSLSSVIDLEELFQVDESESIVVSEMSSSDGLSCVVDPVLIHALRMQRQGSKPNIT